NKSLIWIYDDINPFIFVFTPKYTLIKEIQNILLRYFEIKTSTISFTNEFYHHLFNSNRIYEIQSASFQTNDENLSSITISGSNIGLNDIYDNINQQENRISEMTIIISNHSRVKIYRNSKIVIYNKPLKYEIFETISDIRALLQDGGYTIE
ncbi:hypothetical protein ABWK24_25795, partial [Priestia megaterium]|uniref:hypothetical protein n=1 Tax=Priestia megaterium TaxID=1404 RepID=UPI003393FEA6